MKRQHRGDEGILHGGLGKKKSALRNVVLHTLAALAAGFGPDAIVAASQEPAAKGENAPAAKMLDRGTAGPVQS